MQTARLQLARWISIGAHPFVLCALMVAVVAARLEPERSVYQSVGLIVLFVVLPLAVLIVRQVRRGAWTTVDASRPQERPVLFWVGVLGLLALIVYLGIFQPTSFLLKGVVVTLGMLIVCAVLTRWIKVSLHCACAAQAAMVLSLLHFSSGWLLAGVVPVLAWSRVELGRHRWAEVLLGIVIGACAGWLAQRG